MAIVQAGRPVTAGGITLTAGDVATRIRNAILDGEDFRRQLESWPDVDLVALGLTQEQVNAIKGFYVGDLPELVTTLQASAWLKQLLGVGVNTIPTFGPPVA